MARYTVYLRHSSRGWEWTTMPSEDRWWGWYKTAGHARGAAKRSLPQIVGGRTDPREWEFVEVGD